MGFDIRQSQIINTWPSGAIIDLPAVSLIMLCHDDTRNDWGINDGKESPNSRVLLKDNRLAQAFNVDNFVTPPVIDGIKSLNAWGVRFPRAHYCPKCGLISIIKRDFGSQLRPGDTKNYDQAMAPFYCNRCITTQFSNSPILVPMRFIIATEEGFLDDFPWDWYVHSLSPQERNHGHYLYYRSKGGSASLSDIVIESRRVGDNSLVAKRDLSKIFDQNIFTEQCPVHGNYLNYVKGYLPKPWKGWFNNSEFIKELVNDIPKTGSEGGLNELSADVKRKFPRTLQRGAGNVIFPIIYSSILLPETTYDQPCPPDVKRMLEEIVELLINTSPDEYESNTKSQWEDFFLKLIVKNQAHKLNKLGYGNNQLIGFIKNLFSDGEGDKIRNKVSLLRMQEFKAFTGNLNSDDQVWFKKSRVEGNEYNDYLKIDLLKEVVLLEKLSSLRVYKGFTRIRPLLSEDLIFADNDDDLSSNQLREFQRIQDSRKDPLGTKELPAVEVRGEGLLLVFKNEVLNEWSVNFPDFRLKIINENLIQANLDFEQNQNQISKRYLFLHTLSHILLKELSEDCGYSLSSLSEIIYASLDEEIGTDNEMKAILIYTTTSDSEGSLGGLVEKGKPEFLSTVIKKGVDKARWCSSDPLCMTTEGGQGFMGLNLAACYSCVLLPETSCEKMNKFLDRASVIGTLDSSEIGLFTSDRKK